MCSKWNKHSKWAIEKVTKYFISFPQSNRGRKHLLQITSMSGTIIGRLWMHHLRRGWTQMKICKGLVGECFMCGTTTIGYKPRCLISLEFIRMTSLDTLQWIPSCWILEKALSTSSPQWQTWTSKIQTKHCGFQTSYPFFLLIYFLSISWFVHWSWNFLSILFQPPRSIEFYHVSPSLMHDFFHIQSINMIPLV
jgi:hypothetical protein